jgi:hypothetical protein
MKKLFCFLKNKMLIFGLVVTIEQMSVIDGVNMYQIFEIVIIL